MVTSEDYLSLLIAAARRAFENEPADAYAFYGFRGSLEWEHCEPQGDGYSAQRFTVRRAGDVRSEFSRSNARPVLVLTISMDSRMHPALSSEHALEVLRKAERGIVSAVPLDQAPDTDLGRFVERAMRNHGGQNLLQITPTCLIFTITLDDGPPWISRRWQRRA
jgi:hypothetical protein